MVLSIKPSIPMCFKFVAIKRKVTIKEQILQFEKCDGLSVFRAGGLRKVKMGDFQGLAQWPEILASAG